jgi:hypothetical protein
MDFIEGQKQFELIREQKKQFKLKIKELLKQIKNATKHIIIAENKEARLLYIRHYAKEHRKQNLKIKEKYEGSVTCECGSIVHNTNIIRHRKSNKHLKLMTLMTKPS